MSIIFFNGSYFSIDQPVIWAEDRGYLLGDGLFETMKAHQGRVFNLRKHWQRLKDASAILEIPFLLSWEELQKISHELLNQNGLMETDAVLRLTLSRGKGPRGLIPTSNIQPQVLLTAFEYHKQAMSAQTLWVVDIPKNEHSPLSRVKSLNYLENILAKIAAIKAGADEAVLLNTQGRVASASCANIFLKLPHGKLLTPSLEEGVLNGVTRSLVIELGQSLGIAIEEGRVSLSDLHRAEEVFLTNTLIGIQSVNQVHGRALMTIPNSYSITAMIRDAYRDWEGNKPSGCREI